MPTTLVIGPLGKNMSHCCKLLSPCKYSLEETYAAEFLSVLCVCVCACVIVCARVCVGVCARACMSKGAWTVTMLGNATR